MSQESPQYLAALSDFRRARQRAILERIMARLTQQSPDLLQYEEIREKLHAGKPIPRGLQEIPLDAIAGSVGRYTEFTRSFLPQHKSNEQRWAMVKSALPDVQSFPPIIVYQIGQTYFVLDGNHRVSIARQAGATHIQAYVTEIETKVSLAPDVQPDELLIQSKYADFLEETGLQEARPSADFTVTAPGQYRVLMDQIKLYQHWLTQERETSLGWPEVAVHWYDEVYMPVIQLIRERGILRHFPGRTETDLYAWITRHRQELRDELGWNVHSNIVVEDLISSYSPAPQQVISRVKERIVDAITPEPLETGPAPGRWRHVHKHADHLFQEILVPINGHETGWQTFDQSLTVARREGGRLHCMYIAQEGFSTSWLKQLENQVKKKCAHAGVSGDFSAKEGKLMKQLLRQARWSDLVVYTIAYPPHGRPLARLSSNFNTLVRKAACPVLVVPGAPAPLERALLAYDGSSKAKEALFVAAYLAGKWDIPLVVVAVAEGGRAAGEILNHAEKYLKARSVAARFVTEQGEKVAAIAKTADAYDCDFIIMGGYGFKPLLEVVLGSTVDEILRLGRWPVLICR